MTNASTALVCPRDGGTMVTFERDGISLDQCQQCRGMFLDRGELERLIDAGSAYAQQQPAPSTPPGYPPPQPYPQAGYPPPGYPPPGYPQSGYRRGYGGGHHGGHGGGFLHEFFDED